VALIARRVQLNNLRLFRSVKYRLATPVIPLRIATGPAGNLRRKKQRTVIGPQERNVGEPRWPFYSNNKEQP
jgi:hypothetical protein